MNIKLATALLWLGSFICYTSSIIFSAETTRWNIVSAACALICAILNFLDYRKSRKNKTL